MADTKISNFSDGLTANATDRIAGARSPFAAATDNVYVTPVYLDTYLQTTVKNFSVASALSTSAIKLTGTVITGGSATTTKPHFLIEPTGTTSTNWATTGTQFGVNAVAAFAGNLIDLQVANTRVLSITEATASAGSSGVVLTAAGNLLRLNPGAAVDIGASIRLYTAGLVSVAAQFVPSAANKFSIQDNSGADFPLVGLGGTTSSYPALKRSTTALQIKLADDSAFGGFSAGIISAAAGTATPAAGSTSARLLFGTTAGFGIYYGSGAPTVSAAQGSIYLRSDGSGIADRFYVNTTGSTTWTNFVSAA